MKKWLPLEHHQSLQGFQSFHKPLVQVRAYEHLHPKNDVSSYCIPPEYNLHTFEVEDLQ